MLRARSISTRSVISRCRFRSSAARVASETSSSGSAATCGVEHVGVDIEFAVFEHRVRLGVREERRTDVVRVHRGHLEEESHASRQRRHRVVRGEVGG